MIVRHLSLKKFVQCGAKLKRAGHEILDSDHAALYAMYVLSITTRQRL